MKTMNPIKKRFQYLVEVKKTERKWHFPLLAALTIGCCLFLGYLVDKPNYGSLASIGALTILYFTAAPISQRMVHLAVCSFGMIFSFSLALLMNFSIYSAAISLGLIGFLAHFITSYFKIPPPGNFFFIMTASMASNYSFNAELIPLRIGLIAMGTMVACTLAFLYSVFIEKSVIKMGPRRLVKKKRYTKFVESTIIGVFMMMSLWVGKLFHLQNTYWVSIATIAILQGRNFEHVRQRNLHRILGTFVGIGLLWLILLIQPQQLEVIVIIMILQFIIEFLIVRNYGFAVVFITPLTILLAEIGIQGPHDVNDLIQSRVTETIIGSLLGLLAGFFLHHQNIINQLEKSARLAYFQFKKIQH